MFQTAVQIRGSLYLGFKCKDIGMGEKKTVRVDIACLIRGLGVQRDQRRSVIIGMGLQQVFTQIFSYTGCILISMRLDCFCHPDVETMHGAIHFGRRPSTIKIRRMNATLHALDDKYIFFKHFFPLVPVAAP